MYDAADRNSPWCVAGDRKFAVGSRTFMKSLILAQNERWRRGLGMQVERERGQLQVAWRKGQ